MITDLRSVPSRRSDAICSSSADSILVSSSLVHVVIDASPFFAAYHGLHVHEEKRKVESTTQP